MGLFGTDGVRGVAGKFLTAELAHGARRRGHLDLRRGPPQVLIVRDTRESGEMLEAALAAGVAAGGHALLGGVLPTPGVALLVRRYGFDLAAVVSASHNPYEDNGIKFFGPEGTKLGDAQEDEIERLVDEQPPSDAIGRVRDLHGAAGDYVRELESRFAGLDLSGRRILLDCANGATYRVAPEIFRRLGRRSGARGGRSRRPQHQRGTAGPRTSSAWRSAWPRAAMTWGSPSTATATACWPWTAPAPSWTGTS